MPELEANPRPNYKIQRCCGTCRFFYHSSRVIRTPRDGYCVLPLGPKLKKTQYIEHVDEFHASDVYAVCDHHQWKSAGQIKSITERSGARFDE